MIRRHKCDHWVLRRTGTPSTAALSTAVVALCTTACGGLGDSSWNREDIRQSLFPSHEIEIPSSTHRVPVPADAAMVSIDAKGVIRVSTGEERPLPVSSVEEVVTFASNWVAMNGGGFSGNPAKTRPVHAVHMTPGIAGLRVDSQPQTRQQMVAYLELTHGVAPDMPVGVDPDPDCPVEKLLEVLEVLAFAPDFGLLEPRRALASRRLRDSFEAKHGAPGAQAHAIGLVVEREPSTFGTVVLRLASGTPYSKIDPVIDALFQARVATVLFETAGDGTCRSCPPQRLPGGIPWSLVPEGTGRRIEPRKNGKQDGEDGKQEVYVVKQVRARKPERRELQRIPTPATVELAVVNPSAIESEAMSEPEPLRKPKALADEAPGQPAQRKVVRFVVGGAMSEPRRVSGPDPVYPEAAKRARITGAVILELVIQSSGEVSDIKVLKGLPLGLTEAAVEAVRQWRYEPSRMDGETIDVLYVAAVRFKL